MTFEGDPDKADDNFRKHSVQFSTEAEGVFSDDFAISITDDESDPSEQRFIAIGMGRRPVSRSSSTLTAATIFALSRPELLNGTNVKNTRHNYEGSI